VDKREYK